MVPKIDRHKKNDAINMWARGMKKHNAASTAGISKSTLYRARKKLQETGDIEGGMKKPGPKPNLDDTMKSVLSHFPVISAN